MWPAWEWQSNPASQFLFSSYAESLSIRDSRKCRQLIQSPKYQEQLIDEEGNLKFSLTSDQNTKIRFENDRGGYRIATAVGGSNTGEGGDKVVTDDPNNIKKIESEADRKTTNDWWDTVMSTRLNDAKTGAFVVMQQRSHTDDLTGHILDKFGDESWHMLVLPARYDRKRSIVTFIGFEDPRTEEGELLCPERFGHKEIKDIEKALGPYQASGQLDQNPIPKEGKLIKTENLILEKDYNPSFVVKEVRYWDKAGTKDGGKRTAGVRMAKMKNGSFVVVDVVKGQWAAGVREQIIKQTAQLDGEDVDVWVEQEPGSGGKESAENTVRNLAGYNCYVDRVTGAKEVRAEPFAGQVEISNIVVLIREWTQEYVDELSVFDRGKFTDQVDGTSGAFNKLNIVRKIAGTF